MVRLNSAGVRRAVTAQWRVRYGAIRETDPKIAQQTNIDDDQSKHFGGTFTMLFAFWPNVSLQLSRMETTR